MSENLDLVRPIFADWERVAAERAERAVDTGNEVAGVIQAVGRSPGADVPNAHTWRYAGCIADGKFVYFRAYYDAAEALTAAGVEP